MTRLPAKRADRFIETEIDDEVVLMDLDSGNFFSLSGTALAIWRAMDEADDRSALIARLAQAYGAGEADVAGDVDSFLGDLAATGFLGG